VSLVLMEWPGEKLNRTKSITLPCFNFVSLSATHSNILGWDLVIEVGAPYDWLDLPL